MGALTLKRSKNFVVNKMVELRMIADRSEIMPAKKKRSKKSNNPEPSDNSDESDRSENDHNDTTAPKPKSKKKNANTASKSRPAKPKINKSLDLNKLRDLIAALSIELQPVLLWIEESLNDAAEDMTEDISDDPDDCVPLVPFTRDQCEALGNSDFKAILKGLGFQESETYWRIPQYLTAADIKLRAQIVAGTVETINDENEESKSDSGDNNENGAGEGDDLTASQRSRVNNLIYNDSDNEETPRVVAQPKSKKSDRRGRLNKKFDIFDMVKAPGNKDNDENTERSTPDDDDEVPKSPSMHRSRMTALVDTDDSGDEPQKQKRARRYAVIDSDDEVDDGSITALEGNLSRSTNTMGATTLPIDDNHSSHRIDDDDNDIIPAGGRNKRDRSASEESLANEPNANKNPKRKRATIIDDGDEDE